MMVRRKTSTSVSAALTDSRAWGWMMAMISFMRKNLQFAEQGIRPPWWRLGGRKDAR
jgi:hypothetical protein